MSFREEGNCLFLWQLENSRQSFRSRSSLEGTFGCHRKQAGGDSYF